MGVSQSKLSSTAVVATFLISSVPGSSAFYNNKATFRGIAQRHEGHIYAFEKISTVPAYAGSKRRRLGGYTACRKAGYRHSECNKQGKGYVGCRKAGYRHSECKDSSITRLKKMLMNSICLTKPRNKCMSAQKIFIAG